MKKAALLLGFVLAAAAGAWSAAVTIQVVQDPAKLAPPLSGFVQKGDFLVTDGKTTAIVAASPRVSASAVDYRNLEAAGYVAAFLPPGGGSARAEVQVGIPSVRVAGKALKLGPASVVQEGAGTLARVLCQGAAGLKLEVVTRIGFAFEAGRITLVSEIRNAGSSAVSDLSFSLGANALQSFNFSPFQATAFPKLNFRVFERPDHALGWFNPNPFEKEKEFLPGRLLPGRVHRVSYSLVAGPGPVDVLKKLYLLAGVKPEQASFEFPNFDGLTEVIVREPASGMVFFRSFMNRPAGLSLPLPRGTYNVRAHFFPAVVEKTIVVDGTASKPIKLEAPAFGRVKVSVLDPRKKHVLGKVTFIGLAPSFSPYFKPDNPILTGRGWETAKNSVFPMGETVEVLLPAGVYVAASSRGPQYTREARVIEVVGGENEALEFRLEKAVEAAGMLALDTHMHTQYSDGSTSIGERLRSVAAEGLEAIVSTDHNFVSDYRPDLERLGLVKELAVIVGNEVTARTGSIHYNAFPVKIRPDEAKNGAISVEDDTPATLFGLSRTKDPGSLVHLNHPRSRGLGYFLTYDLESETAASAKAPFSMDFDVMEAMNGAKFGGSNRLTIEDWFRFLNRGYPVRVVGSSDAHGIDGGEPGYSRTYVLYHGPKASGLDQSAVIKAIKEGRSFVTNGPLVSVRADGRGGLGDLVKAPKKRVDLEVRVTGAPWLDVSEVRLVVNGERREPLPMKGGDGRTVKFRDRIRLLLESDAWVVVEVRGRPSLYPVIQQRASDGLAENAAFPYALTNPVFVDVDGNGRYDPVWPEKVVIK
jgi:hypothetical protein